MSLLRRGIALAVTAGSLFLTSGTQTATRVVGLRGGGDVRSPQTVYTKSEKEYYLTQDQLDFARPGYHIKINSLTIPADRKPVADVAITDDLGAPLDRNGVQTPGACSTTFVLAVYDGSTRNYTPYATRVQTSPITGVSATQPTSDSGGTYKDIDVGHFTYTFKTVLPATYDKTKTHTIAAYGRRTMPADLAGGLAGKAYVDNDEFDFRPDGGTVTEKWDEIQEKNACNQCHSPLAAHGDVRVDAKLCVLCHSPYNTDPDTGNLLDMRVFIHKIHRGEFLPSVQAGGKYHIIGFNNVDTDYSTVVFPQDIRNCQNCHEGRDPANKPSQSNVWYTFPARAPCGACHDDINWVTGKGHAAGPQADDTQCAKCHVPQGDQEWDVGVRTAHTVPYKSKQLKGLNVKIL